MIPTALSLQVKMILFGIFIAILVAGGWALDHFYKKDQQDQKQITVDKVVNQQDQKTITQVAQSNVITDATTTAVQQSSDAITNSQTTIQDAADIAAQKARNGENKKPIIKPIVPTNNSVGNAASPSIPITPEVVINNDDQVRKEVISIHAKALWQAYCDGDSDDPQCAAYKTTNQSN